MPTLAAFAYRHNRGMPYVYPDNDLSYAGNFLSMLYKMSEQKYAIERKDNIPGFVKGVKEGKERLMGFGHRVYKNYDPRARIIKHAAYQVFEVTGTNPLLELALELERIALEDEYFVSRKLYPNVDLYSGMIYQALGMPVAMFPVLFAIGRTAGWIAQWLEMIDDAEQKISRPRQIYTGAHGLDYVPIGRRA